MAKLYSIFKIIFALWFFFFVILRSLFHWARTGFWIPKYIHVIAGIAFVIGLIQAYMEFSVSNPIAYRFLWLAFAFPIIVYLAFGIYGGGLVAKDEEINELMMVDRTRRDEMITLLKEKLGPYRDYTYENLLFLSNDENVQDCISRSGRKYEFRLIVERVEDTGMDDVSENSLITTVVLKGVSNRFYQPIGYASFIMNPCGVIEKDGLILNK